MKRVLLILLLGAGCAHVAVEGGDKPIKVDMTVTLKLDQSLDQFYSFQNKYDQSTTQPTTQPITRPGSMP